MRRDNLSGTKYPINNFDDDDDDMGMKDMP